MGKYFVRSKGPRTWKESLANPENQWRKGYSAYELAHSWEAADDFPSCVKQVFQQSQIPLFQKVEMLFGLPEHKVSLPGGSKESQNDLFVLAKANDELMTMMIEGKVSEPFGETVEAWKGPAPSEGKRKRLDYLLELLQLDEANVLNKRYQLLHRTASALMEAKKFTAKNALMLVHSFSESGKGYEDYAEFVELFRLLPRKDDVVGPIALQGINLYFGWVTGETTPVNDNHYLIKKNKEVTEQKVELWSTERLQFEPKNWMKEMRDDLRNQLKLIAPVKEGTLYCKFCTRENDSFFDIENVLLYNVGSGSFSHISNDHIIIERSFENLSNDKIAQTFNHYHLYNYTSRENINLYWEKDQTAVSWTGMQLPVLPDKPHEYWYRMKRLNLTTKLPTLKNETNFGIKINLGVPKGKRVNLTGICKPLIDGIVSAFHSYFGEDLEEMADRLGRILDEEANDIRIFLLEDQSAILGKREVVRRFQKGIQWNPADDFCYQIELKTFNTIGTNWIIDGELYTVKEVN